MRFPHVMIEACAQAAHEVNRAYCVAIGDQSQVSWENAQSWQRDSSRNGVLGVLQGNTPEQSHESWLREKQEAGWVYGSVKNVDSKVHPCMVPYENLPPDQKKKDLLYVKTVLAVAEVLGWSPEKQEV